MITVEEIKKRIFKRHGYTVTIDENSYKTMHSKATFIDVKFGKFYSSVKTVCQGSRHPARWAEERRKIGITPIRTVKERIAKHHGDVVTIKEETYLSAQEKAIFIDKEFGEWSAIVKDVSEGHGNPLRKAQKIKKAISLPVEEVIEKIKRVHDDRIILVLETYSGTNNKAKFLHKKYGYFYAIPYNIFNGSDHPKASAIKTRNMFIEKYGVPSPSQNLEIARKAARNSSKITIKYHWKTNEELECQASYECKVVDFLNENKIDFKWQPKVFVMPNSKTYRPDMFLVKENIWVEIKGWMRPQSKLKWDWFKTQYPTAELWNKEKLKEMRIL